MIKNKLSNKKNIIRDILILTIVGILLFFIHLLVFYLFIDSFLTKNILFAHPFMYILTIITAFLLQYIFKKIKPNMMGMAFLASSIFKMLLAVLFIFPTIRSDVVDKKLFVIQFFIVYFIYLIAEVLMIRNQMKIVTKVSS
ncbi:MAG: hypothetical protein LBV69_03045 [Bacteroidales bacterium]|jgi:hypothetical protein|nr:hypothetical protein [Bacteroidales bacterium]